MGDAWGNAERRCVDVVNTMPGWGIVTTYFDEISLDMTEYSLYIKNDGNINIDKIRVISKIAGVNYIAARQILEKGDSCILKARAEDILTAII